jgi:histone H3/H4
LLDSGSENNATPQFIGALTELVWAQIANTAKDLENFAKHAGRSQISTDDVMLLARRNEGLESLLRSYVEDLRRKNGVPVLKGKGKGKGVKK